MLKMKKHNLIPPELQVQQSSLHHRFVIENHDKLKLHAQKQNEHREGILSTPDLILRSKIQMEKQEKEEEKAIANMEERRHHQQQQRPQQQQQKQQQKQSKLDLKVVNSIKYLPYI